MTTSEIRTVPMFCLLTNANFMFMGYLHTKFHEPSCSDWIIIFMKRKVNIDFMKPPCYFTFCRNTLRPKLVFLEDLLLH